MASADLDRPVHAIADTISDSCTAAVRVRLAFLVSNFSWEFDTFASACRLLVRTVTGNRDGEDDHLITFTDGSLAYLYRDRCDLYVDANQLKAACEGDAWASADSTSALGCVATDFGGG